MRPSYHMNVSYLKIVFGAHFELLPSAESTEVITISSSRYSTEDVRLFVKIFPVGFAVIQSLKVNVLH